MCFAVFHLFNLAALPEPGAVSILVILNEFLSCFLLSSTQVDSGAFDREFNMFYKRIICCGLAYQLLSIFAKLLLSF